MIGLAGLVIEYGHGVLEKIENQRVADLSAYAGAIAYSGTASETAMIDAGKAAATLNGIAASKVTVTLVASPTGTASTNAVRAVVATSVPLYLTRIIESSTTLAVVSEGYAEIKSGLSSCIIAMSASGSGVTLSGGTAISAPACAIASNNTVSVPCGTSLRTVGVNYNSSSAPTQCSSSPNILGPTGGTVTIAKKATLDLLAGNADIATARARLATAGALAVPSAPSAPAAPAAPVVATPTGPFGDITFNTGNTAPTTASQAVAVGCTASASGSAWTFTCPAGTHKIGTLAVANGQSVTFAGTTSTNYVFQQPWNGAASFNFGVGNFTFMAGLTSGYGGLTFGAGSLTVIGALTTGGSGGTVNVASTNVVVTGNVSLNSTSNFTGNGTISIGGTLLTNGTTTIAQPNVNVTGAASLTSTTTLSGRGTLAVGGNLTTSGSPSVAQSTITVTGAFGVTSPAAFNYATTLNVGGLMSLGTYGTMSFAGGTYSLAGGFSTGGSTTATFGAGTYWIGRSATACNGAQFSLCANGASTVFGGSSTFKFVAGAAVGGGSTLTLGSSGTGNSFQFGPATNGNAIQIAGGSTFRMGDATDDGKVFELGGNLNVASGGGSCTIVAAAQHHDINGSIVTAGATILGSGVYTVYGYVGIGSSGGGNVMCNGATTGLSAGGVALIVGANGTAAGCPGYAVCVAAGYSNVVLTAPAAGTYARMAIVGPASGTAGALFTQGSSGTSLSGLVYFPTASIKLDGASSVGNGANQCLQMIGKDVSMTGGSLLASTCISGNASGGKIVMVK